MPPFHIRINDMVLS